MTIFYLDRLDIPWNQAHEYSIRVKHFPTNQTWMNPKDRIGELKSARAKPIRERQLTIHLTA